MFSYYVLLVFKRDINFEYLRGLFEVVVYGGRINNIYDSRVLSSYLNSIFRNELVENAHFQIAPNVRLPRSTDIKVTLDVSLLIPTSF